MASEPVDGDPPRLIKIEPGFVKIGGPVTGEAHYGWRALAYFHDVHVLPVLEALGIRGAHAAQDGRAIHESMFGPEGPLILQEAKVLHYIRSASGVNPARHMKLIKQGRIPR